MIILIMFRISIIIPMTVIIILIILIIPIVLIFDDVIMDLHPNLAPAPPPLPTGPHSGGGGGPRRFGRPAPPGPMAAARSNSIGLEGTRVKQRE